MITREDSRVRIAAEVAYARAMEAFATDTAIYLASGVHYPAENGRQALVLFLERLADLPLQPFIEEFGLAPDDADRAMDAALACIGESIRLIRAAAAL